MFFSKFTKYKLKNKLKIIKQEPVLTFFFYTKTYFKLSNVFVRSTSYTKRKLMCVLEENKFSWLYVKFRLLEIYVDFR